MNAIASQNNCMDLRTIVTDFASPIIAIHRVNGSAIVTSGEDSFVLNYNRTSGFLDASTSSFENLAN